MCWSWHVSLFFVAFQLLSVAFLYKRNVYIDRWYCLLILPFLCQEAIQFFGWAFGDIENATSTECAPFNHFISKCLIVVVYSIPLFISIFSYATSQYHPKEKSVTISWMWKWIMIKDLNLFPILCLLLIIDNECITVGKYGHQKWPPLFSSKLISDSAGIDFEKFFTSIYFYPSIFLTATLYKPLWIIWLPAIYLIITMILMRVLLGVEGWSVWCWACVSVTFWCFIYVPISKSMIKKYKNKQNIQSNIDLNDDDEAKNNNENNDNNVLIDTLYGGGRLKCIFDMCFEKTHQHFVRYKMMDDDDENNFIETGVNFKL